MTNMKPINYSSIIKDPEIVEEIKPDLIDKKERFSDAILPSIMINRNRMPVRNQTPIKYSNSSYDVWERTYFKHILELHAIFMNDLNHLRIPNFDPYSPEFLYTFGQFIRECSSGEISPYIEELPEEIEQIYLEYIIKRQEL